MERTSITRLRPINEKWELWRVTYGTEVPPQVMDELRMTFFAGALGALAAWNSGTPELRDAIRAAVDSEMHQHVIDEVKREMERGTTVETPQDQKPS